MRSPGSSSPRLFMSPPAAWVIVSWSSSFSTISSNEVFADEMRINKTIKIFVRTTTVVRGAIRFAEAAAFGSSLRRRLLTSILDAYHQSMFRRKWWWWSYGEPHFTDHEISFWRLYSGTMGQGVYS